MGVRTVNRGQSPSLDAGADAEPVGEATRFDNLSAGPIDELPPEVRIVIRPRVIDFVLVCLTAMAVSSAAQWLWPYLGVVAAVGAAITLGLLLHVIDGVVQAVRLGLRQRVESTVTHRRKRSGTART